MPSPRLAALSSSLLAALALAASCASPPTVPPAAPRLEASAAAPPVTAPPPAPPPAPRPPPPRIATPMAGEPVGAALGEARLVASSCDDFQATARQQAEARIRTMRAEVDAGLQMWRSEQKTCWEEYRQRAEWERDELGPHPFAPRGGSAKSSAPMAALDGIGLASIGTLGHGAGVGAGASPEKKSAPERAKSASRTNNQVAGVDEADIVKTDGRYVYLAMNGALRIVEALRPNVVSVTRLAGSVRELFVEGDRAVVYTSSGGGRAACTYGYDCAFAGDGTATRIAVLDIADRASPRVIREITLSGSLMASRRIGNAVHTVVADGDPPGSVYPTWPDDLAMCGNTEPVVRARLARLKVENERKIVASTWFPTIHERGVDRPLCGGLLRTPIDDGRAFTTVVSFDLRDPEAPAVTATLESRPGAVFASADALYVSVVHQKHGAQRWYSFYPSVSEVSEIHAFRIGEKPSETRYEGSGVVPGHVLNQFAMDEWYGYLRVATSIGRVPEPGVSSAVSILAPSEGGNLVRVGAVDHIAPQEDIRAVRFDGDRGYVVTFKKTDPLFVLDLYQPAHPAILGELKIPGFSTYMHRLDPEHLLSIGFDADDKGGFAYFNGVILQIFDVTAPTDPKLLHKEKIGTRGSSSAAATNHLAFNYFAERGLLAIPMTVCEGGGNGVQGQELTFSGLYVYDVSVERGFTRLGGVDHGQRGASCNTWWSRADSAVKRSVFLDDLVYSIATDKLKVQRLGQLGTDVADIALVP